MDKTRECLTDYEELLTQLKENKAVEGKHIGLAQRMIWLDEELVEVLQKHDVETWSRKMEEMLMREL